MSKLKLPYTAEFRQQIVDLACASKELAKLSCEFCLTAQGIANSIYLNGLDRDKSASGKGSAEHGAVHTSARYTPPSFQLGQPRHQHRLWQPLPQNRHAGPRRAQFVMPATTQWPKAFALAWNVSRLTDVAGKSRVDASIALLTSVVGWYDRRKRQSTLNGLLSINFKRPPKHALLQWTTLHQCNHQLGNQDITCLWGRFQSSCNKENLCTSQLLLLTAACCF